MKRNDFKIFKSIPTLNTKRLVLRKILISDLDDVFEYASDPAVSEYLTWYSHKTVEHTKSYLKYLQKLYRKGKFYDWGIEINGKMIGTVGFTSINLKDNSAEVGYVINRKFWGNGIAAEAVNEILKFGFCVLKLDKIFARIISENNRSAAVLLKCNFRKNSACEDMIIKGLHKKVYSFYIDKESYFKE